MKRGRKRREESCKDLWALAGGLEVVVREFSKVGLSRSTSYTSDIWSKISFSIFGNDIKSNRHWLWVIWNYNRKRLRDRVLQEATSKDKDMAGATTTLAILDTSEEDTNSEPEVIQDTVTMDGLQSFEIIHTHYEQDIKSGKKKREETAKKSQMDNEWQGALSLEINSNAGVGVERTSSHPDIAIHVLENTEEAASVTETPSLEQKMIDHAATVTEDSGQSDAEYRQQGQSDHHTDRSSIEDGGLNQIEVPLSESNSNGRHTPDVQFVEESSKSLDQEDDVSEGNISQLKEKCMKLRKVCAVPKKFKISLNYDKWRAIQPQKGSNKLRKPWAHYIYDSFNQKNPNCVLAFKYQHARTDQSRKRNSPYLRICAVCKFPKCKARYTFILKKKPLMVRKSIILTVYRNGEICHLKRNTRKRQASNLRRGKIAKVINQGVSQHYYQQLRSTPVEEIMAGNLTRPLTRDILKVISCEVRKASRLHENVLLEMHLTQKIIKECDTNFYSLPGYIQYFQVDPFGAHMYTETGIGILVRHLRKKSPVNLYLDATGSVVSKVPDQKKRVLYYALVLAGQGRNTPPLPVAEMVTNDHTVPSICFWLMHFVLQLSKFTKLTVYQVETDYSWALMQAVLLAFNKESILCYLERCFAICQRKKNWMDIRSFTLVHLCSAHILKAVTQAIGRQTKDKGQRVFATFVFARLQNCQSLNEATAIFHSLCIALLAQTNTESVSTNVQALERVIGKSTLAKEISEDKSNIQEETDVHHRSKTIIGRSPFSAMFRQVYEKAKSIVTVEQTGSLEDNTYYCPGIIQTILDNYLPIFSMWSGLMLGNLKRYAADIEVEEYMRKERQTSEKTRDTNCHVEGWFGIVKQNILMKRKRMRPGEFIRVMYTSLQGRYIEHIMQHGFPDHLHIKPLKSKDIKFSEEMWAKKEESTKKVVQSKFFSIPKSIPVPTKRRGEGKSQDHASGTDKIEKEGNGLEFGKSSSSSIPDKIPVSQEKAIKERVLDATTRKKNFEGLTASAEHDRSHTEATDLWKSSGSEVVVAAIDSEHYSAGLCLRHNDFITLKPHNLLNGEVIEFYISVILKKTANKNRLYQLNHYTTGVIMFGQRQQVTRQSLKNVNFDNYDGAVGFVNIRSNHWKFVYLHALSRQIFLVDPANEKNDLEGSREAAQRFRLYFKMRFNHLGKRDWLNINWTPNTIPHTIQEDGTSCGVFVMQMARETIEQFPAVPEIFSIDPSLKHIAHLRRQMADQILLASESKDDFCSFCGLKSPISSQKESKDIVWIQCGKCNRWYHACCIGLPPDNLPDKDTAWFCSLCQV